MVGCSGINIQYYTQSAIDYLSASKMKYDLIFASNILCETDRGRELSILVQLLSNALSDIGKLLVVERTESKIYEVLEENKNLNIVKYMYQNKRYMIPIENNYFDFVDKTTSSNLSEFIKKEYTLRYALYEQYNSPKI